MTDRFQRLQTTATVNKNPLQQSSFNPVAYPIYPHASEIIESTVRSTKSQFSSPIFLARSMSQLVMKAIVLKPGSFRASTFTVITGMVGSGSLTLSYGIKMTGTLSAFIYLLFSCILSAYSTHTLVYCAEQNDCRTYRKMAYTLYGNKIAIFIHFNLLFILWGICISTMTLTKNLLSKAVQQLFEPAWWDSKIVLLCVALIIILPLIFKRRVSALRYSSMFGLITFSSIVIVVVVIYFVDYNANGAAITNSSFIEYNFMNHTYTIAVFTAGFACHPTILPIYFEMQRRSPSRMIRCLWLGFGFTFIMYLIVAYAGYFTFPSDVAQNLLSSAGYDGNKIILIAQIMLAIYVTTITPLFVHAFRKSFAEIILHKINKKSDNNQNENIDGLSPELLDIVQNPQFAYVPQLTPRTKQKFSFPSSSINNDHELLSDDSFSSHASWDSNEEEKLKKLKDMNQLPLKWHIIVTIVFLLSALLIAIFADNIGTVNSLLASTTVPITCYVFPAMVAHKTKNASMRMKVITTFTGVITVINGVLQIIRQISIWI